MRGEAEIRLLTGWWVQIAFKVSVPPGWEGNLSLRLDSSIQNTGFPRKTSSELAVWPL